MGLGRWSGAVLLLALAVVLAVLRRAARVQDAVISEEVEEFLDAGSPPRRVTCREGT